MDCPQNMLFPTLCRFWLSFPVQILFFKVKASFSFVKSSQTPPPIGSDYFLFLLGKPHLPHKDVKRSSPITFIPITFSRVNVVYNQSHTLLTEVLQYDVLSYLVPPIRTK